MKRSLAILILMLTWGWSGVKGASPTITSFVPASGSVGTLVTITGTNLSTPTAFTIGGVAAIVVSNDGSTLVGMVIPGAATGTISVTTAGGTVTSASNFTVAATPFPNAQQGNKLVGTGNTGSSYQGRSVAISADGNTAIVGGDMDNSNQGAAWIYIRSGSTWSQQGIKLVGTGNSGAANQGRSVAISADGNTAIVGGFGDNSYQGAVWVYTRSGSTWSQQGSKLVGTGVSNIAARQGWAVALSADGNTALIGGWQDNSTKGATWVFTRSGSTWSQQGSKLVGTIVSSGTKQGYSVALSADGNTAIIGGIGENSGKGASWIFTRSGTTWSQQGSELVGTGGSSDAQQGCSVVLSADGNTAMVGGYANNSGIGAAWVFIRSTGTWSQQGNKLVGTGYVDISYQGGSVSLSADGNTAMVGGNADNSNFGASWLFTRSGSTWSQQGSKLIGSGSTGSTIQQGSSVALSSDGKTAIVSGPNDNGAIGAIWAFGPTPPVPPTTQASAINFTSVAITSLTINWTNGDGTKRAVFVKEGSGTITNPVDNTTYTASADWNVKGTQLGTSGYYCVYNGTASTVSLSNLVSGTQYTVQVMEYNGSAGGETYLTTTATNNPNSQSTTVCYAGQFWTAYTDAVDNSWAFVTYGNGLFVAIGNSGGNRVMTSPDGKTWTARTAESSWWSSVTFGNGLYVAVALSGTNQVMTSPDGISWTAHTAAAANSWKAVTYGNGLFVAVASDGANRVMTSPDGISWTAHTAASASFWRTITFGNGLFVAVANGGTNRVMTSPDGINWTSHTAAEANTWYSVTYGNGLFVAVASDGTNRVMTSSDGITWTPQTAAEANQWSSVTYGNGLFTAVAYSGTNRIMTSPDGITWISKTALPNYWYSVTYGNESFVAIATVGTKRVMTSDCTAPPTITSFTPTSAATGATVTITGTNFTGATAVSFGGTVATSFNVVSATSITAVVSSGASGSVSVTTTGGTASLAGFTYTATLTWTGAASTDWNTTGNWNPAHVPTSTDNAIILNVVNDPIVSEAAATPAVCKDLTIQSGAVLTIAAGKALKVNGTLTNNAGITGLVVQSNTGAADGTGALINGTAGVPGTVERYVSGNTWHLISPAATAGETVASFVDLANGNLIARNANNYALSPFNEGTGKWDYYKVSGSNTSGQFGTPAKGFQVLRATGAGSGNGSGSDGGKLTFKGTLAGAGLSIPVIRTLYGWNMIGNPYPCGLDVAAFIAANTALFEPSFQFIYVANILDPANGYTPVATGAKLSSGEGFFVRTIAGGGNINFTTAMKSSVADAFKAATVDNTTIRLTVEDGNAKLGTTVEYIGGATKGLDPGKDAGLFNGIASNFSLFTRLIEDNGIDFTLQVLPDNNLESMVVPVGLVADKGATVTFKAMATNLPAGYKVVLEDKETNTFTRLDEANSSYTVSLNAATLGTGRFYLHTSEIVSAIDESLLNEFKVVPIPEQHLVRIIGNFDLPAKAMVYDMNGKLVATSALTSQIENDMPLTNCGTGLYLIKIESGKGVETVKFVWKQK